MGLDFQLLSKYGISFPKYKLASSEEQALSACKIGYPLAMKVVSQQVLHKSDRGGVILNIQNSSQAAQAYRELTARFKGAQLQGILVQKMAAPGVELIVGGKRDSQFGQLLMLGTGGIFVEIFRDVSFRICPITKEDALAMMRELRSYPILAGARGRKPIDEYALASTLVKVSSLLMKENPSEFDINPLVANDKGCIAVDVRMLR